jgi:anthranilate synthase component 1
MYENEIKSFESMYDKYSRFVFYKELEGDVNTPLSIICKYEHRPYLFLLESANLHKKLSRYTYFGFHINSVYLFRKDYLEILNSSGETLTIDEKPFDFLKSTFNEKVCYNKSLGDFAGGFVGFIGYDMVNYTGILRKPILHTEKKYPVMGFMEIEDYYIYDNHKGKLFAASSIKKSGDIKKDFCERGKRLAMLEDAIRASNVDQKNNISFELGSINKTFDKEAFEEKVRALKEEIIKGECIQVVLSNKYEIDASINPLDFYRILRRVNPSAYMFFLKYNDFIITGSSPETHLKIKGKKAILKPIAGTYPKKESLNMIKEKILKDEKELSEHLMLLDLARNDLSVFCRPETVKVTKSFKVEDYSHVVHIVSEVHGLIKKHISPLDVFFATFPAGTVSGAPKVRAIELIDEIEALPRGFYAGCAGYFSFNGNLDTAILIRSALIDSKKITLRAGAGIVYDSNPEKEYLEVENKLKALITTLGQLKDKNGATNVSIN